MTYSDFVGRLWAFIHCDRLSAGRGSINIIVLRAGKSKKPPPVGGTDGSN
jgi:hypothetical protein